MAEGEVGRMAALAVDGGTVDPVRIDPGCRNRAPGVECMTRDASGARVKVVPPMRLSVTVVEAALAVVGGGA